jgi:riboflavin transporter FmnP
LKWGISRIRLCLMYGVKLDHEIEKQEQKEQEQNDDFRRGHSHGSITTLWGETLFGVFYCLPFYKKVVAFPFYKIVEIIIVIVMSCMVLQHPMIPWIHCNIQK